MQLIFEPLNAVHARIRCDDSVARELYDRFTYEAPGYKFHPAYKAGHWDGKIRMFSLKDRTIYRGLQREIEMYCEEQEYKFFAPKEDPIFEPDFSDVDIKFDLEPREYQWDGATIAAMNKRALFLSPTGSGKSLIIYLTILYHGLKTLLIVPRADLVDQMYGDFSSYSDNDTVEDWCHKVRAGIKDTGKLVTITTWQAIKDMPEEWFEQFEMVVGDEVHLFTAKSLVSIMERLKSCEHRYGFTGTLKGAKTAELTLVGLFGPIHKLTSTSELQAQGHLSKARIEIIVLEHPEWVRKLRKKKFLKEYSEEMDFVVRLQKRNEFLRDLCMSLDKNTLMLFQFVEKHGAVLYEMMKDYPKLHYLHGGVKGSDRNDARLEVEEQDGAKILASFGVFSTGTNIKNLHNLIFASGWKSRVLNLQSIGRVLRLFGDGKEAVIYDVADDMSYRTKTSKNRNHGMKHLEERLNIYNEEGFDYRINKIRLDYSPQEVDLEKEED